MAGRREVLCQVCARNKTRAKNKTHAILKPAHGELVEPPYRIRQFPFQSFDKFRVSGERQLWVGVQPAIDVNRLAGGVIAGFGTEVGQQGADVPGVSLVPHRNVAHQLFL